MIRRFVLLAGVPGAGKTVLARTVGDALAAQASNGVWPSATLLAGKLVRGHAFSSCRVAVLGVYGRGTFDGTDRLSMAVQPELIAALLAARAPLSGWTVFAEGDRVSNVSLLSALAAAGVDTRVFRLDCSERELAARRSTRSAATGRAQPETFLRGRTTKVQALASWAAGESRVKLQTLDAEQPAAAAAEALLEAVLQA